MSTHPSRHPLLRFVSYLVASALVFILVIVALLPSIVSTSWGKELLSSTINRNIPGKVFIGNIRAGWFSPFDIDHLTLTGSDGKMVASVDNISMETSLWHLLFHSDTLGAVTLKRPVAHIDIDASGDNNISRALTASPPPKEVKGATTQQETTRISRQHFPSCTLAIEQGSLTLSSPDFETISISDIDTGVTIADDKAPFLAHLSANTAQGDLFGKVSVEGKLEGWPSDYEERQATATANSHGFMPQGAKLFLKGNISHLPIHALDQLVTLTHPSYAGLLLEALGTTLDISFNAFLDGKDTALNAIINAPNLSGRLVGKTEGPLFTLQPDSRLTWTVTPAFTATASRAANMQSPLSIEKAMTTSLEIQQFSLPISTTDQDLSSITGHITLSSTPFTLTGLSSGPLTVESCLTTLTVAREESIALSLASNITGGKGAAPTSIHLALSLNEAFSPQGTFLPERAQVQLDADVAALPIDLIDTLLQQEGMLVAALGPLASVHTTATGPYLSLPIKTSIATTMLSVPALDIELSPGKSATLKQPAAISYLLTEPLLEHLVGGKPLVMRQAATITTHLDELIWPLTSQGSSPADATCRLSLQAPVIAFEGPSSLGTWQMENLTVALSGEALSSGKVDVSFGINMREATTPLAQAIGNPIQLKTTSMLKKEGKTGLLSLGHQDLTATSPLMTLKVSGDWSGPSLFVLSSPITASWTPTTTWIEPLIAPHLSSYGHLATLSPVQLSIDPSSIFLDKTLFERLLSTGTVTLPLATFTTIDQKPLVSMQDTTIRWSVNAAEDKVELTLASTARGATEDKAGTISATALGGNVFQGGALSLDSPTLQLKTLLSSVPMTLIETLSGMPGQLSPFMGNKVNVLLNSNLSGPNMNKGWVSATVDSELLSAYAAVTLDEEISLQNPSQPITLTATLTPAGYAALQQISQATSPSAKPPLLTLEAPTQGSLTISALRWPIGSTGQYHAKDLALSATVAISSATVSNKITGTKTTLEGLTASVSGNDLSREAPFTLSFKLTSSKGGATPLQAGAVTLSGKIENLVTSSGALEPCKALIDASLAVETLPSDALADILGMTGSAKDTLLAAAGSLVNIQGSLSLQQMTGPVMLKVDTSNAKATFDGALDKGVMTLRQPFAASITVSPELGQTLLTSVNPMLLTAVSGQQPVDVAIDVEGFSFPLQDFAIDKVAIGKGALSLGTLVCKNGGLLKGLMGFLKAPTSGDTITVWLTPLYFSMKEGVLACDRGDALANRAVHFATWGTVDFNKQYVDMILGIAQESVATAFGVSDLPSDYMLQLPMSGKFGKTGIDWAKAATQVTSLTARKMGTGGKVFGTLLDAVGGGKKPPAPTTQPFPWAGQYPEATPQKGSQGSGSSSPVNQILNIFK